MGRVRSRAHLTTSVPTGDRPSRDHRPRRSSCPRQPLRQRPQPRPSTGAAARACGASTRASEPCTCCAASTSTSTPGQVTALVGDNGAGKSTLIKGIAGIHAFDSGEYTFEGKPVTVHGPKDANALGIEVVYQDLALCDNLDVVHNMFLGREIDQAGLLDEATMETKARETLDGLSVRTLKSVRTHGRRLSGGQRQTVAIARAVLWNSRIVILDEPTAALGVAQTEQVLLLVRRLADNGLGVVLISHNLNDVFEVADDIAVLYLGQMVAQVHTEGRHQQPGGRADHHRPLRDQQRQDANRDERPTTAYRPDTAPAEPSRRSTLRRHRPRLRRQGPRR